MKPADPVIIPGKLKRAMEASSYAANVLSALNEASYFLDIIESEYPEMFDESEIQDLKLVKSSVRNIIHQTNIATDPLFSHFEEAVSSYHAKSRYESVLIPKELVAYENDKRIRIQFPEFTDLPCEEANLPGFRKAEVKIPACNIIQRKKLLLDLVSHQD